MRRRIDALERRMSRRRAAGYTIYTELLDLPGMFVASADAGAYPTAASIPPGVKLWADDELPAGAIRIVWEKQWRE